jgi:phosphoglycerate dehydrogenase-like enzyme
MSWNVLITARTMKETGALALELLREAQCNVILPPKAGPLTEAELLPLLPKVDAVLASMDKFTDRVLGSPEAACLKIISRWGVGYDAVDIPSATRHGIVVAYCPGVLNEAVADYAFSLLCTIARRIHEGHLGMRAGEWRSLWGHDIHGKTLGILGCGRIGQAMARRATGFGMKILAHDICAHAEAAKLGIEFVSLDELLARSDFLSLHAALTPGNKGLIGEAQMRRMKPSSYIINTARAALIDESALVKAVTEKWIAGAALDAFSVEPLPPDHPIRKAPNVLITPHQASFTYETGERVSTTAATAIVDLLHGRKPRFVVDDNVFNTSQLRTSVTGK